MLLLIGDPGDLTAAYLGWLGARRGLEVHFLSEQQFGVDWVVDADEQSGHVAITSGDEPLNMEAMLGAAIRFNPDPPLPDGWTMSDSARQMFLLERRSAISHVVEMSPGRIVNRPSAGRSNASKPLHMTRLEAIGFEVPPWVASSNPQAVEGFLATCPEGAVVKATSGLRSHVRMVGNEYVDRLRLGTTPSVIQRYIAGYEARVHVVGDWVFGSRVDAAAVDYRFDEAPVRYQPVDIPPAIASLCREAARSERLELAGLDFRVSADDRWWCLEMNPVPTFLPYEAATGQPIGDAVIDLITGTREHADRSSPLALWMAPAYSEEAAATHDQSRDADRTVAGDFATSDDQGAEGHQPT